MGKIHTFVFNSSASSLTPAGNVFNCDWSRLNRNKKYIARFTFVSASFVYAGATIPNIFMDLGSSNVQLCPAGGGTPYNCNFLGVAFPWVGGANVYLNSGITDNPQIWLDCPPSNNQVLIQIMTSAQGASTLFAPTFLYCLTLSLEEQDYNHNAT